MLSVLPYNIQRFHSLCLWFSCFSLCLNVWTLICYLNVSLSIIPQQTHALVHLKLRLIQALLLVVSPEITIQRFVCSFFFFFIFLVDFSHATEVYINTTIRSKQVSAFIVTYPVNNEIDKEGNDSKRTVAWEKAFIQLAKVLICSSLQI